MRANDRGTHTVPAGHLYPHQWAWDSAFAAIGWCMIDVERALIELESLMDGAWPDGRVPHIRFRDLAGEYFPGPAFWGTSDRSSISQPPVWAAAALRVQQCGGDRGRLTSLLAAIVRSHEWFLQDRDLLALGLVAVAHPWESGMDNSPAWDLAKLAVDPADAPPFERVDTKHVANPAQRPTDDDYARYAALVAQITAADFGLGQFAVYDPGMSAMLAWADDHLARLADELDEPAVAADARRRRDRVTASLVEHLWDESLSRFVFVDALSGHRHDPQVVSAYLPAIVDLPTGVSDRLIAALERDFDTPHPLPTTAPSDPAFDPVGYWRGPTWVNVNWLFDGALGGRLRRPTLELVERHGFREYFDPISGDGLGTDDFTWTAALVIDWLGG
ncbi:MAG: neutral trehalase [Ilumatobacteraceae bacterium]